MSESEHPNTIPAALISRLREHPRWKTLSEVFYGMFFYESELTLRKQRGELETMFVLVLFGDMLGVPILPPYYSMRLLPYTVPHINSWRNRMLRERDITDLIG